MLRASARRNEWRTAQESGLGVWGEEGGLGAKRGDLGVGCECSERGQEGRERNKARIKASGVR